MQSWNAGLVQLQTRTELKIAIKELIKELQQCVIDKFTNIIEVLQLGDKEFQGSD